MRQAERKKEREGGWWERRERERERERENRLACNLEMIVYSSIIVL